MPKIESAVCLTCKLTGPIKFMNRDDEGVGYYCNVCYKKMVKSPPKKLSDDPLADHFTNQSLLAGEAVEAHLWLTQHGIPMIEYSEDGKLENTLGKYFILPLNSRLMMFELTQTQPDNEKGE